MRPTQWEHFYVEELQCPCCGKWPMNNEFMQAIVLLRRACDFKFPVSSGYRCSHYNAAWSTGPTGPHTTGRAIDLSLSRGQAFELLRRALASFHFTGIGLRQHGDSRFIHLDNLVNAPGQPRPTIFTYP